MIFALFHDLCPEVAERETRTVTIMPDSNLGLPEAEYGFLEMFCNEPGCDCRRVMFSVISSLSKQIEAVVAWGWESRAFYERWLGMKDPEMLRELQGPSLNMGSLRTKNSEAILDLARNVLLKDAAYIQRVQKHYALFCEKRDGKKGAKAGKLRTGHWVR